MMGGEREDALHRTWANSQLSVAEKVERLLTALEGGLYVVLMDHMEDLLDSDGVIADAELRAFFDISLSGLRGARLLVTSRSPITFQPDWMGFDKRIPLVAGLRKPMASPCSAIWTPTVPGVFAICPRTSWRARYAAPTAFPIP